MARKVRGRRDERGRYGGEYRDEHTTCSVHVIDTIAGTTVLTTRAPRALPIEPSVVYNYTE